MARIAFFIDGFNLYHALKAKSSLNHYKWLNLKKLCGSFIKSSDTLAGVLYFTAYATHHPDGLVRHQKYVKALTYMGVETVFGEFKLRDRYCTSCKKLTANYHEKQTDVNIALELFRHAVLDKYDTAIIVSGDSDLIPAIKTVKKTFPHKSIGVIIPIDRRSEILKATADFYMKMKLVHLETSQLPEDIVVDGVTISRPDRWKKPGIKSV